MVFCRATVKIEGTKYISRVILKNVNFWQYDLKKCIVVDKKAGLPEKGSTITYMRPDLDSTLFEILHK